MSNNDSMVIAVLTYKRPEDIGVALPRLLEQAASATIPCSVLVVDNDPDGSARFLVESFDAPNLSYVNERHPGISAARNRALAESSGHDLLVFIDDDEVPVADWLNLLLAQYSLTRPAAVAGRVISEFEVEPSAWVASGDFFERPLIPSGTPIPVAATNNLLLDLNQVRSMRLEFDERFGISGGSDTLFTRQLLQRGGAMVHCDEAVVIDRVPASRLTRDWVLRRSLRSGNSWSRVAVEIADGPSELIRTRAVLSARGGVRLAGGLARYSLGMVTRAQHHQAHGLRTAARGIGMLSGAFGYIYSEYKRSSQ